MRVVHPFRSWLGAGLCALAATTAACAGDLSNPQRFLAGGGGDGGGGGAADCSLGIDVEAELFVDRCTGAVCHSAAGTPANGLDLESPGVAARLRGAPAVGCTDALLIDPDNPGASLLLAKLGTPPDGCGEPMPFGLAPLSADEIDCVTAYVEEVAGGGASESDAGAESDAGGAADAGSGADASAFD